MDGNGRWAREKGLPRSAGHKVGIDRVKDIVTVADSMGIKVVTLFAFSTENWLRPKREINILMRFFDYFLTREIAELKKRNIKFTVIGQENPLPPCIKEKIRLAERSTQQNTGLRLVVAVNYGARQEIVAAARGLARAVHEKKLQVSDINEPLFESMLSTAGLPDPDLLIRTSGEMRISNFLLWQLSYAELYFVKKYWPDFRKEDLEKAVQEYQRRQRRFGGVDEE